MSCTHRASSTHQAVVSEGAQRRKQLHFCIESESEGVEASHSLYVPPQAYYQLLLIMGFDATCSQANTIILRAFVTAVFLLHELCGEFSFIHADS